MPISLQIPPQPANADDVFSFTLVQQGATRQYTLKKNLAENTVEQLRVLVKKLGLCDTGRLKKFELACLLQPYVFFKTAEEATAAWPILGEPLAGTESELRGQLETLLQTEEGQEQPDPNYIAHFRARREEIQVALKALAMEAEREKARERGDLPPSWWKAGNFVRAEDSDDEEEPQRPYLRVLVQAIERDHDGYCSGIDEDGEGGFHEHGEAVEIVEESYLMTGFLPLKDPQGNSWNFQGPDFDPGWGCASAGSGVCGIRPSVRFVSMTLVQ